MPCARAFDSGKATFPTKACRGARDGEKMHGCEIWTGSGTQLTWAQGKTDFQSGGVFGEKALLPTQCNFYSFTPQLIPRLLLPP